MLASVVSFFTFFASGIVQGVCGFGAGPISMSVLPLMMPLINAAAVSGLTTGPLPLLMTLRYRRNLTIKKIIAPLLVYMITAMVTVRLSLGSDAAVMKRVFGAFLLLLSIYHFTLSGRKPVHISLPVAFLMWAVSGVCSGLFSVGGPLMVIYFLSVTDSKEEYLADIELIFFVNIVTSSVTRINNGLITAAHLPYIIPGIIGIVLGLQIANRIVDRIDEKRLTVFVYIVLGISGLGYLLGL